jgi:hypothetical protein
MTHLQPPRIRDGFAKALVRSAKSDSPRAGAKARALSRLDARARGGAAVLAWCRAHAPLFTHGLRLATSAALVAASIGWSVSGPSAPYDTTSGAACRASAEWIAPGGACGDRVDPSGGAVLGGGSGSSSGSSSG